MSYHIVCLYPNTPLPAAESGSGVSCAVPGNPTYGSMDFVEWYKVGQHYSVLFCVREYVGVLQSVQTKQRRVLNNPTPQQQLQ